MNEIIDFKEALRLLKQQEIVYTLSNNKITYYYMKDTNIVIKALSFHSQITYDDFVKLYCREHFYLYIPKDEKINSNKDEQYYSWKSKNAN